MTKREKIILLLKSTSINREAESSFKNLIRKLPIEKLPKLRKLQEKFLSRFEQLTNNTFESQVELYDRLLSEDAIDASNAFYSSIEGQEIISKLPQLNEELGKLSLDFTAKLAKEFISDLLELAPSEEELALIGFTKINADIDDIFGDDDDELDDEDEEDVDKIDISDDDDVDGFDQFLKDYKID